MKIMTLNTPRSTRISLALVMSTPMFLMACSSGSSLADSTTASRVVGVSNGVAQGSLSQKTNGSVTDARSGSVSRVGLVAYASGIDAERGQMVTVAGIEGTPNVGAEVQSGVVKYDANFNYQLVEDVSRRNTFISGRRQTLRNAGQMELTADFGAGTLKGSGSSTNLNILNAGLPTSLLVDGQINGQAVTGTATVTYPVSQLSGRVRSNIDTDLNGQIGDNGVIATFTGTNDSTTVAGGIVGAASN